MELKILEHCCYAKYLSSWWNEEQLVQRKLDNFFKDPSKNEPPSRLPDYSWTLIHYGDHMLYELIHWCYNMCLSDQPVQITLAVPCLSDVTMLQLSLLKSSTIQTITASPVPNGKTYSNITNVVVADHHLSVATICGNGRYFVLSGGLIQSYLPGKYFTQLLIGQEHYLSVQPQLNSMVRLYGSNHKQPN